jgi:hypothetical protein
MHLRYVCHSLERIQRDQGSRYSVPASLHDNCGKEVKSISAERTATIQFPEMVGRFVIPTDYDSQDRRGGLAGIVPLRESEFLVDCTTKGGSLVKVTHVLVFFRDRHRLEVIFIACGLEITTDKEEIYFVLFSRLEALNVTVDRVKLPMAAAFHGNLGWNRSVSLSRLVICGTIYRTFISSLDGSTRDRRQEPN